MPQLIGRYEIKEELGRGGMATVYLAFDPRFQREVAIKVLPRQFTHDPRFLARFEQEARTIAALEHFAIVPVHDFGEEDDAPYLVMRYMSGGSLRERMDGQPLPLPETSRILQRLAPALDKAHACGIIHRDLKPGNVLFDEDDQPYLADFGIARMAEATHTMTVVGTPGYMSPEQVEGQLKLDWRSDIYALGVMLFEMLSGRQPYKAETPAAQMLMHIREPVPDVLDANPELPAPAQVVIDKAMAKDREERYQTAEEIAVVVQHLLDAPAAEIEPPVPLPEPVVLGAKVPAGVEEQTAEAVEVEVGDETLLDTPPEELAADAKREANVAAKAPSSAPALHFRGSDGPRIWGQLPAWAWWAGAIAVVLLLVFGIRTIFGGGGETLIESTAESNEAIGATVATATATEMSSLLTLPAMAMPVPTQTPITPTSTATSASELTETPTATSSATATSGPTATPSVTTTRNPNVPPPVATLGSVWERPLDKMQMVYVPSGIFPMGGGDRSHERPVHDVTLDRFWIDETEVTNAHYVKCVTAGECVASFFANNTTYNGDDYPVVGVTWNDADTFCRWVEGLLPSEAQWEYAARGSEGLSYPWGEEFSSLLANYCDENCPLYWHGTFNDGYERAAPVGSYPNGGSWVGALDMAGNVTEWMNDWYDSDYYANSPANNPVGPELGERKVLRGGGWGSKWFNLSSANRHFTLPYTNVGDSLGFRCVLPGS